MEKFINKIICDNCINVMKQFPDNCIDLTITSPPYDKLRQYENYSFNFEEIAKELLRITKSNGVVVWVVSDATINGSETGTSFKQALYFKEIGFNLHDTMIYGKNNPPPLNHNRYEQQFEYMFIFSKNKLKTFNPIMKLCAPHKHTNNKHSTKRQGNSDELLPFHKIGTGKDKKIKNNIWFYNTGANKTTKDKIAFFHPAIFPEKLAYDHIISWSNKNDLILDPMCGSGTVCKIAKMSKRNFIGIDMSKEYCEIAEKRIKETTYYFDNIENNKLIKLVKIKRNFI